VFVLQAISTPVAVGTFSLAFGLSTHIFAPAQALIGPLIPAVSGLREIDEASVGPALARTVRASSTIVGLLTASALPAFAALVPLLYGEQYRDVPPMLLVLGIAGGWIVMAQPIAAFVHARLRAKALLWISLAALAVDALLAFVLIPFLGAWGAVVASTCAGAATLLLFIESESRGAAVRRRSVFLSMLPGALGALAAVAGWTTSHLADLPDLAAAALGLTVGIALLLAGLRMFRAGLTAADAAAIAGAVPLRARPLLLALLWAVSWCRE
jgi:O-antigen/teichoic acid export membrane protein